MADAAGNYYGPFDVEANPDAEDYNEPNYYRMNKKSGVLTGGALTFDGRTAYLAPIDAWVRGAFFYRDAAYSLTSDPTTGSAPRRDMLVLRRTLTSGTGSTATPGGAVPVLLQGAPATTPADPVYDPATDEPLWSWQMPGNGGSTITGVRDHRRFLTAAGDIVPVTVRAATRNTNNVLNGGSQSYGTSSAGRLVIPARAGAARLVRIDCDVDIYCGVAAATAGSLRLYANTTELLPSAPEWGTFHNQGPGVGSYIPRPVTAHVRWEGVLPDTAQNIWVNVASDPSSQPFWVTSVDLTVAYR